MSGRVHDKHHFFKYSSLRTAKLVIESQRFRWSSPNKFNDPFDHQVGFRLEFTQKDLANAMAAAFERIVFGEQEPTHKPSTTYGALTLQLRAIRDRLPREEVLHEMSEAAVECAQRIQGGVQWLGEAIRHVFSTNRVFCVSERCDNVVMWSHYAEEHRGVVFKLGCVDAVDNTLLAARPVKYTDRFIAFPSAEEYAKHLTEEVPFDLAGLSWDICLAKHTDWAYEREWRVLMPMLDQASGDGYSYYKEDPCIFEEIYLGCRMAPEDKSTVLSLVREHLPRTKVFAMKMSNSSFELALDQIA